MKALNHAKLFLARKRKLTAALAAAALAGFSLIGQPCFGQVPSKRPTDDSNSSAETTDDVGAVGFDLQWFGPSTTYVYGLNPAGQVRQVVREKAPSSARSPVKAASNDEAMSQASAQQVSQGAARQAPPSTTDYFPPGQLQAKIANLFGNLPGRKAVKFSSPGVGTAPGLLAVLNGQQRLFSASANKVFILCERLRQLDSPNVTNQLGAHELQLDKNVWSLGSTVFNPPALSGLVSEKTTMEAMIVHSDNTATDMILKEAGPNRVRQFIGGVGLPNTLIPDSTRALFAYVQGALNYLTISWDESLSLLDRSAVHPLLNDIETLASSANDLVSFYERALQGGFFRNQETLTEFRRILALGDINYLVGFPLGVNAFGKAGYFDSTGTHGRCIAGGMFTANRWVYFAAIINWDAASPTDPATEAAFYDALRKAIAAVQTELAR